MSRARPVPETVSTPMPVETMRTLLVCRGPIAYETLEVYRRLHWRLPHVVVSSKEWIAELHRTAPWITDLPPDHVHYVQEYTDVEAVLQIATEHRIDAVYPGYGFLAESAAFAERVQQAGMRFIGPAPETLHAVGDKDSAIALAKRLGIPTIAGDDALVVFAHTHRQEETAVETVRRTLDMAQRYPGYPIRLKHPAGGGGKGQRVLSAQDLQALGVQEHILDALAKLWAEMGVSATADDAHKGVLIELNIPRPLHWEVQLFGDGDTVVHFAARDCSLQNHGYQKFIELALHPAGLEQKMQALEPRTAAARLVSLRQRQATLERICNDALRLGTAIRLRGAATMEFLIDTQGEPYFLEVNPRIQVEHGVTEGIARVRGRPISLVELQQRVAAGEKLDFQQQDITFVGDAIEVRLNAWHEDLSPVLGGVVHTLRLKAPADLRDRVRIDASGLLQRHKPWIVPSYDANFALIIVSGDDRHDTLTRLLMVLDTALQVHGNAELQTNLQPIIGLLTLMQVLPSEAELRTDMSLVWTALAAVVEAQKHTALSLLPRFPRRPGSYDPARFARLLQATLESGFAHPSRLLAYYLKRLAQPAARPLAPLEVLWHLAEELTVPLFEEERRQGEALCQAADALWKAMSASGAASRERFSAFIRDAAAQRLQDNADYLALSHDLLATTSKRLSDEAAAWLHDLLGWLSVDVPAVTALITILESTRLHTLLTLNDDLSPTRPAYLEDETTMAYLYRLLSTSLRPAMLRHGELLSPMEATIYHQPEPGAPPFVQIGEEVKVGQTLALLEAMKMFSELPSPVDGVLVDILVESGQGVKTGTPLFRIATQDAVLDTTDDFMHQTLNHVFQNRFGLLLPKASDVSPFP
jgi:acetyl-CoA carboxylase biotin carboxylase subunit